ncbi:hypothetical protein ARMA_1347 [Ardenticatena maritima]|uniref:Uncharacterized protein n=1 Tax=Ardenticatena maritima TaxID=872965 RepID=A0A0M9UCG1_9CHLR|nr:hypothetical protein ARMA_1347 [Ardenticatena maritima]
MEARRCAVGDCITGGISGKPCVPNAGKTQKFIHSTPARRKIM